MSETKRNVSGAAVDQIMGNMNPEIHNPDGQYIRLTFTPPTATPVEGLPWNIQNQQQQQNHYLNQYTVCSPETQMGFTPLEQQYNQVPYNFIQPSQLYNSDLYEKHMSDVNQVGYDVYASNGVCDLGMFPPDYKLFVNRNLNGMPEHNFLQNQPENLNGVNSPQSPPNRTQLIENLVGNWVVPNTSGTYSPFGNVQACKLNTGVFDGDVETINSNVTHFEESKQEFLEQPNEENPFPFTRDHKKPRIVAEIKPMRPSYSDVLTKSPPNPVIKTGKTDTKDTKHKKENKRNSKTEKNIKLNGSLNRSNTSSEIKDLPNDKNMQFSKNKDKSTKNGKISQLNRKWVSLDDVTETFDDVNKMDLNDSQKLKRNEETNTNKTNLKVNQKKIGKNNSDFTDVDANNSKNDHFNTNKNIIKKSGKIGLRQKNYDGFGSNERPGGKRTSRIRKRDTHSPFGIVTQKFKQYLRGWWKMFVYFVLWLVHLISDICSLSIHLSRDMVCNLWKWLVIHWGLFLETSLAILQRIRFVTWIWEKIKCKKEPEENNRNFLHSDLQHNINMPTTGEEAMKRLLACKGKDPYSILGVTPTCTDDDIKKYYKRQAFLVHPDKNQQPGAEEAFKILVHAFDMIGKPEKRAAYDRGVVESAQVEQAWSELTELLAKLQQKVEAAANTIRCSACGQRHKRIKVDRPCYAARNCTTCKIHHSAREGDIWAEAKCFGFLWHYYACMEGGVYDITEWAGCQKDSLKHLRPDSHHVQYRIVLGKQNGQTRRHSSSPRNERPPDLENLLNSLYGQPDNLQNTRRKNKKTNK